MKMVGALSVVGSSMVDSHTCPCLCLDSLVSYSLSHKGSGDLILHRNSMSKKVNLPRLGSSLELGSSFIIDLRRLSPKGFSRNKNSKKQRKARSLVIVNEVAGQYEDNFEDVKTQIVNLFTFKAVRAVLNQLDEMNPTQYRWFYDFVVSNKPGDGKQFLRSLVKEKQELAERVMIKRLHLYGKWVKKCDHAAMYKEISDQNLELMHERLIETDMALRRH